MSLNLEQKQVMVAEISAEVAQAQAVVLAEYRGMKVGDMTSLRAKARAAGVYLRVLKNSLARRAVADTPFAALAEQMVGPLAYGVAEDPVALAKVLHEFARSHDKLVIKGGSMANFPMSAKDVANLASLPSRDELLAQLMRTMQAPVTQFARTLSEIPTRLVRVLAAVRDEKQGSVPA